MKELDDLLQHHGVKGMKWGVIRWRQPGGLRQLRTNISNAIRNNVVSRTVRARTAKHEARYIQKGVPPARAKQLAIRRRNGEIAVAAVATVAITAASIAGVKIAGREFFDKNVKTSLQTLADSKDRDFSKPFYAVWDQKDKRRYEGLFSKHLMQRGTDAEVFKHVIEQTKGLKVASHNNARKALQKAVDGNKEFAELVKDVAGSSKIDRSTYQKFNQAIASIHSFDFKNDTNSLKAYYDTLKSMGYNGLLDINDQKFSGFNAKNPAIIFDTGKDIVKSVSKVSQSRAESILNNEIAKLAGENLVNSLAPTAVMYGGGIAVMNVVSTEADAITESAKAKGRKG